MAPDKLKTYCITLTTFVSSLTKEQLCCHRKWLVCYCYWSYSVRNIWS